MKIRFISLTILVLCGLFAFTTSCEKDEPPAVILYPEEGYFGNNILNESQFDIKVTNENENFWYSVRAELPEDASLKIIIRNVSHTNWAMSASSQNGWARTNENPDDSVHVLLYYASGPEVCDGKVRFGKHGSNTIEFYENHSTEPNRIKDITY